MRHNGAVTEPDEHPVHHARPQRVVRARRRHAPPPHRGRHRTRARAWRSHRPGRGGHDLPAAVALARPLSESVGRLHDATSEFLGERAGRTPFVIGVAGSVAVGQVDHGARAARAHGPLAGLSHVCRSSPRTGFSTPMRCSRIVACCERKGFPESYDRRALRSFVWKVKSGVAEVHAPVYSHITYDIVPGASVAVRAARRADRRGPQRAAAAVSASRGRVLARDQRLLRRVDLCGRPPGGRAPLVCGALPRAAADGVFAARLLLQHLRGLSDEEATARAGQIWDTINAPNLVRNIAPTRSRATIILRKGASHQGESVSLRKL